MKRLTITQEGYELSVDNNILPAEFSAGIEVEFIKDKAYEDYTVLPSVKYDNKTYVLTYVNGIVTLPAQAFEQDGAIYLAFLLSNGNEHINTYPIELFVVDSVGGSDVLPDEKEIWVSVVENQVDQIMDVKYVSIMNEVLEANKKLNLDTIELQKVLNQVVETLNRKIDNEDFVPSIDVGNVITGEAGTPVEVNVVGEKNNRIIHFKIPQGSQGVKGIQGIQGVQGVQGIIGKTGLTGETGMQGIQGVQGVKGDTGLTGPQGAQGIQGQKGDKGDKGDRGDSGVTAPLSTFFTMFVDAAGNLYAKVPDGASSPPLTYDPATGNLYWVKEV